MVTASVEFFNVVLFFHILAVVMAFGPPFVYGLFFTIAQREGGAGVPAVGKAILTWDRTIGTAAMVVILLSGIYLASRDPWEFSDFFVSWGFVAIIALFGLVHGVIIPRTRRLVEAAERDLRGGGEPSGEVDAIGAQLARVGPIALLIVVLTIYVMTAKPFL